ncbi:aminotransferase class IV [Marinobacter salarius]|uniref:aminotransferase class IV n=1 Tax=Marinobacter salarius TaxID=1420917 RepID=UPI0010AA7258|nr:MULTISPECIES: aminotransferase class IV [Marinobacter]MBJ7299223.1 aminotransferase class IV [Marinobacter salarius]HIO31251.1 aminodeoxychorismate lyase [Marinobacter salarius]HIO99534.1 aminodeoxychorismate lyase [Marinobacter salarius]
MLNVIRPDGNGVSATDRGLAYGDGLFETIRMRGRQAVLRSYHLDRMVADAGRLGIPVERSDLDAEISRSGCDLASQYADDWVLKLVLTRGSGGRGYRSPVECEPSLIVTSSPMPMLPPPGGVVAAFSQFPLTVNPRLAGIKTLNRLEQVMASREFSGEEFELIMANADGQLLEGTRTNLIIRMEGEWVTPPVESLAVAGVMRQFALECLRASGHTIREQVIPPALLSSPGLCGLYLVNSVVGIVAVRRLGSVDLPVDDGLETICDPLKTLE